MTDQAGAGHAGSLNDYLAAERTFLAWIRTGLALMGFGFVVARFGLFLQEFQAVEHSAPMRSYGLSLWFGTTLVAIGVPVNLDAGWQYARTVHALDRGERKRSPLVPAVVIAIFLALVGLAMTIYLSTVRGSSVPSPVGRTAAPSYSEKREDTFMTSTADNGIVSRPSHHTVDETVEKLKGI